MQMRTHASLTQEATFYTGALRHITRFMGKPVAGNRNSLWDSSPDPGIDSTCDLSNSLLVSRPVCYKLGKSFPLPDVGTKTSEGQRRELIGEHFGNFLHSQIRNSGRGPTNTKGPKILQTYECTHTHKE